MRQQDPRYSGSGQLNESGYVGRDPISPYPHAMGPVARDADSQFDAAYFDRLLKQLQSSLDDIGQYYVDQTNRVDEYRVQGLEPGGETVAQLELQPDYECSEIITGVIVTGPAAGVFAIKLGKRVWNLVMPATGILLISPIQISLDRSADRYLIPAVAGDWSMELTGYAETGRRGRI